MLGARYGGTEMVNASRHAFDKIANGQCMFFRRDAYDAMGGHAAVRGKVAEDLALAQLWFSAGRRVTIVLGLAQLSHADVHVAPRAGGWLGEEHLRRRARRDAARACCGRRLYPLLLVLPALTGLVPPLLVLLGA